MSTLMMRERIVARRLAMSIPTIPEESYDPDGIDGRLISEELYDFIISVRDSARTAWSKLGSTKTAVLSNDDLLKFLREWLSLLSLDAEHGSILGRSTSMCTSEEEIQFLSALYWSTVSALMAHAAFIFPEWPIDLAMIPDSLDA